MAISSCSTPPHLMCCEGTPNLAFCVQFESPPGWKWHSVNHNGLADAIRSTFHLSYASKEDFETLQQQWLSLLAVHHPICRTERVPQIWHFVRVDLVWK